MSRPGAAAGRRKRRSYSLKQSWPLLFSGMAIMIYVRLDTVMLKMMQGDYAVGLYAAATRVSEVWYFIPVAIVLFCIARHHPLPGEPGAIQCADAKAVFGYGHPVGGHRLRDRVGFPMDCAASVLQCL